MIRQKLFILLTKDLRPYLKWRTVAWVPLNHFSVSHYRLFVYLFIMPPYKNSALAAMQKAIVHTEQL